jgi:hypothetical protein
MKFLFQIWIINTQIHGVYNVHYLYPLVVPMFNVNLSETKKKKYSGSLQSSYKQVYNSEIFINRNSQLHSEE